MPTKKPAGMTRSEPAKLRIGAVSRLTKIPVDTLRAWERRYAVVAPDRADSAARLYGPEDVSRLTLIKRLVDSGHAIGSVASIARPKLEKMLALHQHGAPLQSRDGVHVTRVVGFGDTAPPMDATRVTADGFTLIGQYTSWETFESSVMERAPHAMVIEIGALLPHRVESILRLVWRSAVVRTIVFYGFAPASLVDKLMAEGVIALRAPPSHALLMRELRRLVDKSLDNPEPPRGDSLPRLIDDGALAEFAKHATTVACECPRHLVDIIRLLTQFEHYSAECAHGNDADAAVHATLRATTARARAFMESALIGVAEHEGITLPASVRAAKGELPT